MKRLITITFLLLTMFHFNGQAQEKYGNTLNLGVGIGYYGYGGGTMPVVHANYEFDVSKNFTLAPFVSYYSYSRGYYWGEKNKNYPYKNYYYHETVIPVGVKGTYYFDELLNAGTKWDFYLAGSLGFAFVNSSWDNDYYGDRNYYSRRSSLYLDAHIGAEFHLNSALGIFLDLSSGVSTVGLAIHLSK